MKSSLPDSFKTIHWKSFDLQKLKKCARNELIDNDYFSDEAHFLLLGHVDSINNVFWEAHSMSTVYKDHYTLWSTLPGLLFPNMA